MTKTQEVNSQGNVNMYVVLKVQNLYSSLAQSVEHLTFNQGDRSSNLRWVTTQKGDMTQWLRSRTATPSSPVRIWVSPPYSKVAQWWSTRLLTAVSLVRVQQGELSEHEVRYVKVIPGSMVKRLRHRPFTAVTGVQIPLESLIVNLSNYADMAQWQSS